MDAYLGMYDQELEEEGLDITYEVRLLPRPLTQLTRRIRRL